MRRGLPILKFRYGGSMTMKNLVEESIWPMIATESLKALGGLGLLSLGGKYLLRCIFEVGIIFLIITQSRCLVGIFEFGTVFLLHLCRRKRLSFQLIEKKLKRRWRLCVNCTRWMKDSWSMPSFFTCQRGDFHISIIHNNLLFSWFHVHGQYVKCLLPFFC
ncbi:uncharacterized protein LOC131246134 isoform X2 [Magnolia sinica]|uniref:uncharacterized protein LOC131246134 isoform X2 n=1 Tax=Magnolia sinica TaxID=86752 RepID=UPI002658B358|nr:uncharacterized protein LOC131246134 isoform X2 [Magnolia sinica]